MRLAPTALPRSGDSANQPLSCDEALARSSERSQEPPANANVSQPPEPASRPLAGGGPTRFPPGDEIGSRPPRAHSAIDRASSTRTARQPGRPCALTQLRLAQANPAYPGPCGMAAA